MITPQNSSKKAAKKPVSINLDKRHSGTKELIVSISKNLQDSLPKMKCKESITQQTEVLPVAEKSRLPQEPEFKDYYRNNWEHRITSYHSLCNLLDTIEHNGETIYDAHVVDESIDNWFNAYLCSDEFTELNKRQKEYVIKKKEVINRLLFHIDHFMQDNEIGIYSKED